MNGVTQGCFLIFKTSQWIQAVNLRISTTWKTELQYLGVDYPYMTLFFPSRQDFLKNFEQQFGDCIILWTTFMKGLYLYIYIFLFAICLMNVHTWGTSKNLVALSTLKLMYHELSWFNCMNKFTKQMWRNQETNLLHPPFWLYLLLTKINKAMHSLFVEA